MGFRYYKPSKDYMKTEWTTFMLEILKFRRSKLLSLRKLPYSRGAWWLNWLSIKHLLSVQVRIFGCWDEPLDGLHTQQGVHLKIPSAPPPLTQACTRFLSQINKWLFLKLSYSSITFCITRLSGRELNTPRNTGQEKEKNELVIVLSF